MGTQNLIGCIALIKDFEGKPDTLSVNEFLNSVDKVGKLADWDDSKKMNIAQLKMTGRARLFRDSSDDLVNAATWDGFCKVMRLRFGNKDPVQILAQRFLTAKQLETETVLDFSTRLNVLCNKAYPAPEDEPKEGKVARQKYMQTNLLMTFITGLKDEQLQRLVQQSDAKTFTDAVDKATKLEADEKLFTKKKEPPQVIDITAVAADIPKGPKLNYKKLVQNTDANVQAPTAPIQSQTETQPNFQGNQFSGNFRGNQQQNFRGNQPFFRGNQANFRGNVRGRTFNNNTRYTVPFSGANYNAGRQNFQSGPQWRSQNNFRGQG